LLISSQPEHQNANREVTALSQATDPIFDYDQTITHQLFKKPRRTYFIGGHAHHASNFVALHATFGKRFH
jgi:hypothetical protein